MGKRFATKVQGQAPKVEVVADLKSKLDRAALVLVVDYRGSTVKQITNLRNKLRNADAQAVVAKNTLMNRAIDGTDWEVLGDYLSGPSALLFAYGDISKAIKAYQEFVKETKQSELRGGAIPKLKLSAKDISAIADLPSREQLFAQAAGAINSLATKIAVAVKEVPSSVGRAVKAVETQLEEDKAA
jgi:large subunit ribosomal protein L10